MFWRSTPPAEIQLQQIASALGIKPAETHPVSHSDRPSTTDGRAAQTEMTEQGLQDLSAAGIPVFRGPLPADVNFVLEGLPLS
ncbi:MAG: hypothetical protein ACRCV9_16380 [Burkholderiaceae bacterium]